MKAAEFSRALWDVKDEYIQEALTYKPKKKTVYFLLAAVAACLCIAILGGVFFYKPERMMTFAAELEYYNVQMDNGGGSNEFVPVGNRTAYYVYLWPGRDAAYFQKRVLPQRVGEEFAVTDHGTWYRPKGAENLQYLILKANDGRYSLYRFYFFWSKDAYYTLADVMYEIYGIENADDIAYIVTTPDTSYGGGIEAAKDIQENIGTHTYADKETVSIIYEIIKKQSSIWDPYNEIKEERETDFKYSFYDGSNFDYDSFNFLYGLRRLEIHLKNGTTITGWTYSALSGNIYITGGSHWSYLPDEDVYTLNGIFGIA